MILRTNLGQFELLNLVRDYGVFYIVRATCIEVVGEKDSYFLYAA